MARNSKENAEIQELVRRSQASRILLTQDAIKLKQRLDVPNQIRKSLKSSPTKWLLGSMAAGLGLSLVLRGKKKSEEPKKQRSLPMKLVGLTLTAARPIAKVWLTNQLKNWLAKAYTSQQSPFTIEPNNSNVHPPGSRSR